MTEGVESGNSLYRIDLTSGTAELVGALESGDGTPYVSWFGGLGFDDQGRLLGSRFVPFDPETRMALSDWSLIEIDTASGKVTPIGTHDSPPFSSVQALEWVPEDAGFDVGAFLAGYELNAGLGSVNTTTGNFNGFLGELTVGGTAALAYDTNTQRLFSISQGGDLSYFDPGSNAPIPRDGVPIFTDGHSMRFAFPTENPGELVYTGTAGAAFNSEDNLIYAIAHVEGPSDPDTSPAEDDPFTELREDLVITNNLDSLLFTIDPSDFDGMSSESLEVRVVGDTGLSWASGLAIRSVSVSEPSPGDLDGDGDVDSADLTAFLLGWTGALGEGEGGATREMGDLDGDGDVDSADMTEMLLNWTGARSGKGLAAGPTIRDAPQRNGSQISLPEPSAGMMGTAAVVALCCLVPRNRKDVSASSYRGNPYCCGHSTGLPKECGQRPDCRGIC